MIVELAAGRRSAPAKVDGRLACKRVAVGVLLLVVACAGGRSFTVPTVAEDWTKPPCYPDSARARGIQGTVVVEASIGPDGRVRWTRVFRSIPMLDSAAVDAVRGMHFDPPLRKGRPVGVRKLVPVRFALH